MVDIIPQAKHLLCVLHVKQNLKRLLANEFSYCAEDELQQTVNDIFGVVRPSQNTFIKGLIDASSTREFNEQLAALKEIWEARHPGFTDRYFDPDVQSKYIHKLILEAREPAGFGDRLCQNNATETANSMVRKKLELKPKRTLTDLETVRGLKRLFFHQERQMAESIVGRGEFRRKNVHATACTTAVLFQPDTLKKAYIDIFGIVPDNDLLQHLKPEASNACVASNRGIEFPISFVEATLADEHRLDWNAARTILQQQRIREKAETKVQRNNCVDYAIDEPRDRVERVVTWKTGTFEVDCRCDRFMTKGICCHSIAVAAFAGSLPSYLEKFHSRRKLYRKIVRPTSKESGRKPKGTRRKVIDRKAAEGATIRKGREEVPSAIAGLSGLAYPSSEEQQTTSQQKGNKFPWELNVGPFKVCSLKGGGGLRSYASYHCCGCRTPFSQQTPDLDLILVRTEPNYDKGKTAVMPPRDCAYHLNIGCVRRRHPDISLESQRFGEGVRREIALTEQQKKLLLNFMESIPSTVPFRTSV
ncbi:uncharacterized protein LOC129582950 [Paramacrobiotus metropolitanus]|uniref:uncharacterized protein LOC129582950 n=1 Tax=Paramacrobiotus metropolitanus TaxID=2943436 RepID=UPI0024460E55|nr:uncharacterized protein LOC129582950 [Paramacrobiotus metropolitanus]